MVRITLIKQHLEVVGSDDGHVGRVDRVLGDQIELAKIAQTPLISAGSFVYTKPR